MEHTVLLAESFRYKGNMGQKKSEQVLIMLVPETFADIKSIAAAEDRPLGYVARELMIRGLGLYRSDGRLRDDANGDSKVVASIGPATIEEVRRLYEQNQAAAAKETRAAFGSKLNIKNSKTTDDEEGTERDDSRVSAPRKRAGGR
jgi:hypothetical protein